MKKIISIVAVSVSVASVSSATLLAGFEMNDAAGKKITQIQNDAVGGGAFHYGANNMLTDGSGHMVYTLGGTNANYGRVGLIETNTTGQFKMSASFSAATLSGGGSLTYAVRDHANTTDLVSFQLILNNDRLRLVMQNWSGVENITAVGDYTLADPLNVEVTYDLGTDLADFSWTYGTTSGGTNGIAITDGTADSVRQAYQPSNMTATDSISTDYLRVESIPEPATLGLLGLMGGAMIFIRRRFMI